MAKPNLSGPALNHFAEENRFIYSARACQCAKKDLIAFSLGGVSEPISQLLAKAASQSWDAIVFQSGMAR